MAARVLVRLPECQTKRPQFGADRDLGPPEHREGGSRCSATRRSHPDRPPLFNFEHCPNFKSRVSELGQHHNPHDEECPRWIFEYPVFAIADRRMRGRAILPRSIASD